MKIVELNAFACKESTFKKRKKDIENLVRMWYDCTNYVIGDVDHNATETLAYLKKNAATQYTLNEYKRTVAEEYFPKSMKEAEERLVSSDSDYSMHQQGENVLEYLKEIGVKAPGKPPEPKLHWSSEKNEFI